MLALLILLACEAFAVLCVVGYRGVQRFLQLEQQMLGVRQRFDEAGVAIEDTLSTDVKFGDKWLGDDEVDQLAFDAGRKLSRRDEWFGE